MIAIVEIHESQAVVEAWDLLTYRTIFELLREIWDETHQLGWLGGWGV